MAAVTGIQRHGIIQHGKRFSSIQNKIKLNQQATYIHVFCIYNMICMDIYNTEACHAANSIKQCKISVLCDSKRKKQRSAF